MVTNGSQSWLVDTGLANRGQGETAGAGVFSTHVPSLDMVQSMSPHKFVTWLWSKPWDRNSRNLNGLMFEYAIACALLARGITPFYTQASLLHIPNVKFDFVLFREGTHPIVLSCKTSLRERWKQAELEGRVLKNVYTSAECYLVTLDAQAATTIQNKIEQREVIGIDKVILADSDAFSSMVDELSTKEYSEAQVQQPVQSGRVVQSRWSGCKESNQS